VEEALLPWASELLNEWSIIAGHPSRIGDLLWATSQNPFLERIDTLRRESHKGCQSIMPERNCNPTQKCPSVNGSQ
jgi:hypothetical protein